MRCKWLLLTNRQQGMVAHADVELPPGALLRTIGAPSTCLISQLGPLRHKLQT
jgi:hypothetical protein